MDEETKILLRLSGIRVRAGLKSELDLVVLGGSFFVLLGDSDTAASLLLRTMAGRQPPISGTCRVGKNQINVSSLEAAYRIGTVVHPPEIIERISSRQYIRLVASSRGINGKKAREVSSQLIEWCEIGELAETRMEDLDYTGRYLVNFAGALIYTPSLICLEGPIPGKLFPRILDLKSSGRAIVATSPDLMLLPPHVDRIGLCDRNGMAMTLRNPELADSSRKITSLDISFHPPVQRELLENLPGIQEITAIQGGYRLGMTDAASALVSVANMARANARWIIHTYLKPPSVRQLISFLVNSREPGERSLFWESDQE